MENNSWHSYPSIFNLGHRAVRDLLNYPHVVEEKVDGSQFSFGVFAVEPSLDGNDYPDELELRVRSKGAVMNPDAPEKMFNKAVETVRTIKHMLHVGWTYRAEYLAKPKHNTLAYDRVPDGHLIVFDVSTGDGEWLDPASRAIEARRINLESVPLLNAVQPNRLDTYYTTITLEGLRGIIDNTQSILGGQLIEGVVIKPLVPLYGQDKKTLMGKFVSERFKEAHKLSWSKENPSTGDVLERIVKAYATEARWMKAIQHLREAGELTDSPQDIGKLIIEVKKDTGIECKEEIMRALWKYAWPHIERGLTRGLPEYYKNELLRRQFEQGIDAFNDAAVGSAVTEAI